MKQGPLLLALLAILGFACLFLLAFPPPSWSRALKSAPLADDWLGTIFGPAGPPNRQWTMWAYLDRVTLRTLLLPSEPHAPEAGSEPGSEVMAIFNQLKCRGGDGPSPRATPLFVDVGMNTGFFSLLASVRGCRVVAVEMQPSCVEMMRFAERANGLGPREGANSGVDIIQAPLSDKAGVPVIIDTSRVCERTLSLFSRGATRAEMRTTTLDEIFPPPTGAAYAAALTLGGLPAERIALVKLGIEGFEPHALAGARQLLGRRRVDALLVTSTWWPNVYSPLIKAYETIAFVYEHGYQISCIDGDHAQHWHDAKAWLDYGASADAHRLLPGDAEGRRVSSCDNVLICLQPCAYAIQLHEGD